MSASGCSFYFLAKNEPPLLNAPACGTRIPNPEPNPQQIIFSWMPRGTASPNPAASTEYEFELFEIRFKGRDINNIVQTTRPVFRTRTDFTQLVYGPAEPPLLDSMEYAWRVRAIDKDGRDAFRNNGCSEVCSFIYGGLKPAFTVGMVQNFRVEAQTHRRAQMNWTADAKQFEAYRIEYKKKGEGYQWNRTEVKDSSSLKVFDLEGDSEYEARVQGYKQGFHGPWSEITSFKTPKPRVIQCGDPTDRNAQPQGQPMLSGLVRGTTVTARGLEITITRINSTGTDGWYKGEGWVNVPFLANSSFGVTFQSIFVNTDREVTRGEIKFMSQPIDEWVDQTIARQQEDQRLKERQKQQEENQEKYADMEFDEEIVLYDKTTIADVQVAADGTVTLVDEKGTAYAAREREIPKDIPKPLIIEDKNGDQWVVQKGRPPVKVPGGGLSSAMNLVLTKADKELLKKALRRIRQENDEQVIARTKTQKQASEQKHDQLIARRHSSLFGNQNSGGATISSDESDKIMFSEPVEVENTTDTEWDALSDEYLQLETKSLYHQALYAVSDDLLATKELRLLAADLKIEGAAFSEYATTQRNAGRKDEEMVPLIKQSVEKLIKRMIDKMYE